MFSKYRLLIGLVLLLSASCKDDFLEKEPIGRISKNLLFEDMDGARAALAGAYNRMAFYYSRDFTLYPDAASDDIIVTASTAPGGQDFLLPEYNFTSSPENGQFAVGRIWRFVFQALDNVNNIINAIPNLKGKEPNLVSELDEIRGQALIMRALCHFDISRVYAQHYKFTPDASHWGAPILLKTPGPDDLVARATMRETYAQIIKDLQEGAQLLKNVPATNRFKTSYYAANALLSRVYLYMEEWDLARQHANLVLSDPAFALSTRDKYSKIFLDKVPESEVIWALYSRGQGMLSNGYKESIFVANDLYTLYEDNDIRKTLFSTDGKRTLKYSKEPTITDAESPIDPIVIRTSEVLLNRAEAYYHLNRKLEAAEDLDKIIKRANPTATLDPRTLPDAALFNAIKTERRKELAFEGHRLYDITRRKEDLKRGADCTASVCELKYPNNRFVLPIPTVELNANKAMQPNPGIN